MQKSASGTRYERADVRFVLKASFGVERLRSAKFCPMFTEVRPETNPIFIQDACVSESRDEILITLDVVVFVLRRLLSKHRSRETGELRDVLVNCIGRRFSQIERETFQAELVFA